jgi:hypothetical protein
MIDEERRLAELLQQAVPQPRRRITVADIAAQVARRPMVTPPRVRPWLPALVAAAVLLVVAASSVWLISGHSRRSAPATQSSSAITGAATSATDSGSPSRTASSSPTPTTPDPFRYGVVAAFNAQLLNGAPIAMEIVSGAGAVYGREPRFIDRFEPRYGAITARVPADPDADWPPLVTSHAFWQTVTTPGVVTIQRRDPRTLQLIGSSQIPAPTPKPAERPWDPVLAADPDDSEIFLGNADQIYSLDPSTGTAEHLADVPAPVGGLAVSPDGSRLYVGVNVPNSMSRLLVLDIRHGLATLSNTPLDNNIVGTLLATSGGVWATLASGMETSIRFAPLADLAHTHAVGTPTEPAGNGGGGVPAFATLAGGVVWLSGNSTIACADARTGAIRARAEEMDEHGFSDYVSSVQFVAGHYFAGYATNHSNDHGLAMLDPPSACR